MITKDIGSVTEEHKFIRADRHASYDDAVEFSLGKARQIIDQQGIQMFGEAGLHPETVQGAGTLAPDCRKNSEDLCLLALIGFLAIIVAVAAVVFFFGSFYMSPPPTRSPRRSPRR